MVLRAFLILRHHRYALKEKCFKKTIDSNNLNTKIQQKDNQLLARTKTTESSIKKIGSKNIAGNVQSKQETPKQYSLNNKRMSFSKINATSQRSKSRTKADKKAINTSVKVRDIV